jgi:hypothetical protein
MTYRDKERKFDSLDDLVSKVLHVLSIFAASSVIVSMLIFSCSSLSGRRSSCLFLSRDNMSCNLRIKNTLETKSKLHKQKKEEDAGKRDSISSFIHDTKML